MSHLLRSKDKQKHAFPERRGDLLTTNANPTSELSDYFDGGSFSYVTKGSLNGWEG